MQEFALGMPTLHRMRRTGQNSHMEQTGRKWREEFGK
jgi:ketol-acid reductoisomerase